MLRISQPAAGILQIRCWFSLNSLQISPSSAEGAPLYAVSTSKNTVGRPTPFLITKTRGKLQKCTRTKWEKKWPLSTETDPSVLLKTRSRMDINQRCFQRQDWERFLWNLVEIKGFWRLREQNSPSFTLVCTAIALSPGKRMGGVGRGRVEGGNLVELTKKN